MAITELVTFRIKLGSDWKDILPHIRAAEIEQAAWSGYPLHFFDVVGKPGEFALLSGWKSVEAHTEWIVSETNQGLMRSLQPYLDVASLVHLTIEPSATWKDVRVMLFEKLGGEGSGVSIASESVIWEGEGHDAEGKVEGRFKLMGLKSIDILGTRINDHRSVTRLARYDIPPASLE